MRLVDSVGSNAAETDMNKHRIILTVVLAACEKGQWKVICKRHVANPPLSHTHTLILFGIA